jgi:hypothetical protein
MWRHLSSILSNLGVASNQYIHAYESDRQISSPAVVHSSFAFGLELRRLASYDPSSDLSLLILLLVASSIIIIIRSILLSATRVTNR